MRLFFEVAYQGTHYRGWQMQKNANTVQEELAKVLNTICKQQVEIVGSGRTDAGVHCEQQFFHITLNEEKELSDLLYRTNTMLPFDIAINSIRKVLPEAHARFDAVSRVYEYRIHQKKNPFLRKLSYYYNKELDVSLMNEAAKLLTTSEQDFESFSKVKTDVNHFRCTITEAQWEKKENHLVFHITANRFLRGMVRAIVGTLLDVGEGNMSVKKFGEVIASKDRGQAGRAAPARGLFLVRVNYPDNIYI